MQLIQKWKIVSEIFLSFSKFRFKFEHFPKKKMTLIADVFFELTDSEKRLEKCLKSPVSEDPSKNNMVNGLKHCS